MPLYDYRCDNCGHELTDVKQSIHDDPLKKCPECKKHKLERVPQLGLYASVSNATTLGQHWDRKEKALGSYHRSEVEAKKKARQPKPNTDKIRTATTSEIKKMTPTQRDRYIQTGDK